MSKAYGSRDLSETFQNVLTSCAKALMILGALCTLLSVSWLIFLCFRISADSSVAAQAVNNIHMAGKLLIAGAVGLGIGAGYIFWGEDVAGAILIMISAALYTTPMYVPGMLGGANGNETIGSALSAVATGGMVLGVISIFVVTCDIVIRVRQRVKVGVKADQMKYGKGIKEEKDRQNVFMGNCWQLPYCRKFVRERCPIFHSKRTCWKEKVGCMCEEEVIRNAMENKPIPKDALLASQLIPKNFRLTEQQKIERCKSCVIFNEHQRHKYKLMLPVTLLCFGALYGFGHGFLVSMMEGIVDRVNDVAHAAVVSGPSKFEAPTVFVEGLLFVFILVLLTYTLKMLEFCIFKLKI